LQSISERFGIAVKHSDSLQFTDFTVAGLHTDKKISELVEQWQGLFELISQSVTLNVQFVETGFPVRPS
jgi:hypothetical protein